MIKQRDAKLLVRTRIGHELSSRSNRAVDQPLAIEP
jgi:hypothetical protein